MSHRKSDLGIPRPRKSAKVVLGWAARRPGAKTAARGFAPLQSRTDSEVILPTAMAGGNTGLVLCQVGGQ
jgi:hypothetical protein